MGQTRRRRQARPPRPARCHGHGRGTGRTRRQQRRRRNRQAQAQRHRQAHRKHRDGDHRFDERQRKAPDRRAEPSRHEPDEGARQRPERAPAKNGRPEPDRDHGEDVVEPECRMRQACHEGAVPGRVEVSQRVRGGEGGCCGDNDAFYCWSLIRGAVSLDAGNGLAIMANRSEPAQRQSLLATARGLILTANPADEWSSRGTAQPRRPFMSADTRFAAWRAPGKHRTRASRVRIVSPAHVGALPPLSAARGARPRRNEDPVDREAISRGRQDHQRGDVAHPRMVTRRRSGRAALPSPPRRAMRGPTGMPDGG